jgi:hypothetical protein
MAQSDILPGDPDSLTSPLDPRTQTRWEAH